MSSWFFVIFGLQLLLISCNAELHTAKSKSALVEGILQKLLNLTTSSFTKAPPKVREKIIIIIEEKLRRSAKTLGTPNSEKYIALIMDAVRSIKSDNDIILETPSEERHYRNDESLRSPNDKSHKKTKHVARNNEKSSEIKHKSKKKHKKHHSKKPDKPFTREGIMKENKYFEESNEITPKEVQFAFVNNIDVNKELQEPIRPRTYGETQSTGSNAKYDYDHIRQNKYGKNVNTFNSANDGRTVVKHFSHAIKPYSNVTFASPCYKENVNVCNKIQDLKYLHCSDHSKLPVEKLCDNYKDCSDYTDEVECAKHGVNKVRETSRIISDLLHSFSENCYTFDVEELFVEMQTEIWTNVVENQFEVLEEHAKHYAKTDQRKFRVEPEHLRKTVNEVAVTVSSISSALTKIICSNEPRLNVARKSNDFEIEELIGENNTGNIEPEPVLPRTCNCTDNYCADKLCPQECETICMHRYNLGRLQCNTNGIEASISLDLICDGKSDCLDDEDESRCLIVPGFSLFESNNMYKYVLDMITTKMKSVYFQTIRSSLLDLHKSIKKLQAATSKRDISRLEVKGLRELCFSEILGIYDKTKSYARSIIEMIDIYIFLLAVNEKLVVAMKLSNTGNARTTNPDECMCMNNKCLYSTCSEACMRACSAETKFKRYHCGESLYSNKTISIEAICDGKFDCPDQDDEKGCSKGKYPYHGYGPPHFPPGPPGHPGHPGYPGHPPMYPPGGIMYYPVHPAYFYPYPPPPNPDNSVQVVEDAEPQEIVPTLPGETVELPWSTYRWVPACLSQRSIPPGALRVGTDADGAEIYAGRAPHEGDILPAKVIPSKNACYVSWGGEEILIDQFEVLVPAMFAWQFSTGGAVPPGAVEAGVTADGEKLYYGRVTHDGCTTPGKIQPSHETCYYPFGGEEKSSAEYEVLVLM